MNISSPDNLSFQGQIKEENQIKGYTQTYMRKWKKNTILSSFIRVSSNNSKYMPNWYNPFIMMYDVGYDPRSMLIILCWVRDYTECSQGFVGNVVHWII